MRMIEELMLRGADRMESAEIRRVTAGSQVFCIDNVAEYLYAQTSQEVWDVKTDFPCLAPPFSTLWMEYSRPSKVVSCVHGERSSGALPYRVGFLIEYATLDQIEGQNTQARAIEGMQGFAEALGRVWSPEIERELETAIAAGANLRDIQDSRWGGLTPQARTALRLLYSYVGCRAAARGGPANVRECQWAKDGALWLATFLAFVQARRHAPIFGPFFKQVIAIRGDGSVVGSQCFSDISVPDGEAFSGLSTLWFPALLAISFCHCKNVAITPETKPAALKKRQLERGKPSVTFKVLQISPMQKILRNAGAAEANGLKRALHICRGHFANYETKGLFGKYLGRFWVPQHVRGTLDAGAVVKDYAVNMPVRGSVRREVRA